MTIQPASKTDKRFNPGSWLILSISIVIGIYTLANLAYRFTLPTDGWQVNEFLAGFNYSKNLMGEKSSLQPDDQVIAVDGIKAEWQSMSNSSKIRSVLRAGNTLDYTVVRDGQEIHVPVTLLNWQLGKVLLAALQDAEKMSGLLTNLILVVMAGFVFFRQPGNPATGPFLIIMIILACDSIAGVLPTGFPGWIDPIANFLEQRVTNNILFVILPFALIRFALVFPHPKPIHQRNPWISWGIGAVSLLMAVLLVFIVDSPIPWYWFVFTLFLTLAILIHNAFTMRDAVSRAQLLWGVGGLIIGFGMIALTLLAGTLGLFEVFPDTFNLISLISSFAILVMGSMLAIAILRYRLFDIDLIIRKTLQYTLLTGLLVLIYFGSVVLLQRLVEYLTGENSPVVIVISTLVIAALFNPLRRSIQDFIDRRFYRKKYDAEHALAKFAETARDEVELDHLTTELLIVVAETFQPQFVNLWVQELPRPHSENRVGRSLEGKG